MASRIGKGFRKHVPNGQDEATTAARAGLRSTEKMLAIQRTSSSQSGLDDSLKALANRVSQADGSADGTVIQQIDEIKQQVDQVKGENGELRSFFQEALQEAERLKQENEELRKLGEDAVLDQQLSKALQETDKLKLAADAYKKELLQQKVTELQSELNQTSKRLKTVEEEKAGLAQALKNVQGARGSSMDTRSGSHTSLDGTGPSGADADARQALLNRLQSPPEGRGDVEELLAAAAKALKDAGTAEAQLADAVAANAKLQAEVDQLNDTVFSKTFRAPSAWAEREVKYKMDKKAWDTQVDRLQGVISKLKAENVEYRDNNKTNQFEARIQELEKKVRETEGEKVSAQRALHELQLDMQAQVQKYTQLQQTRRHQDTSADDGISSMIEEFDRQHVGVSQPSKAAPKSTAGLRQAKLQPATVDASANDSPQSQEAAAPGTHVQGVIVDMNAHSIGLQQPGAAPQAESDTHLHIQPTADVSGATPAAPASSSNAFITQGPQTSVQIPSGTPANQFPHTTAQLSLDAGSSRHQQGGPGVFTPSQDQAPSSPHFSQAQGDHRPPLPAASGAALQSPQPSSQAVIDDQPQGSAHQLQLAAEGAASAQAGSSTSEQAQLQPEQLAGPSQPSEVHALYQHKDYTPSQPHGQSQASSIDSAAGPSQPLAAHASYQHKDFVPSEAHRRPPSPAVGSAAEPSQPSEVHASYQRKDYVPSDAQTQPDLHSISTAHPTQEQLAEGTSQQPAPLPAAPTAQPEPMADQSQKLQPAANQAEAQVSPADSESPQAPADASPSGLIEPAAQTALTQQTGDQATSMRVASYGHAEQAGVATPPAELEVAQQSGSSQEAANLQAATSSSPAHAEQDASDRGAGVPAGPLDEDVASSDEDLLTLRDAVHHVARSTRQSRANSGEALDKLDPSSSPPDYPAPPEPAAGPVLPQANPRVTFEDAGHLSIPGIASRGPPRASVDLNGAGMSEASEQWTEERVRQLEEDKAAIERLWGEHAQENDIGVLKFKLAEFESRCEMYEAQVTKMQRSMERSDTDKAKVEEQLARAIALTHSGDKQGLAAMRERLQDVVTGRVSKTTQLEERLKEAEQQLQQSYRERDRLEKQRARLEHELASWSTKLGVDIPVPSPDSAEPSEPSASSKGRSLQRWRSSASGFEGLSDGEVEVMHLREENEALMESLVRAKVDLAETEGEYLKNKRSLIRANEKLANFAERIDYMKAALLRAGLQIPATADSPSARSDTSTQPFGTPRSVAGTPKTTAAQALEAHL